MKQKVQLIIIGLFILISLNKTYGQQNKQLRKIEGIIWNDNMEHKIEYATVMLFSNQDSLIAGVISDETGRFQIHNPLNDYYLKIDFLGYESLIINSKEVSSGAIDLEEIKLTNVSTQLEEYEVRAEKSINEFKLDKRVFNVGQDVVSQGGSALDVLNNVPSVDVNIEGDISLRGNQNVLILINGKASVLTEGNALGTITSDMIDKVEVITSPSAKYDAEGTTGIINLVIKKENKEGLNGAITFNTGVPHNHSVGLSLNRRTEKFNLFSQLGAGYRRFPSSSNSYLTDRTSENPNTFYSDGEAEKNEQFYNFILGADYHITKYQMLTLTGQFGYEIEDENSTTNYRNENYLNEIFESSQRTELTESTNPKWEYSLNYEKSFKKQEERSLKASFRGSYFGKNKDMNFTNQTLKGDVELNDQKIHEDFANAIYSWQADYEHPINENSKLETGAKYEISDFSNDYQFYNLEEDIWQLDTGISNLFKYNQKIAAAYGTYEYEWNRWGIKAGLRFEQTNIDTKLEQTGEENDQNYYHFFPSLHTSYKLIEEVSLQLGYSKRIHRPHMWDLNPFTSLRDIYNIHTGNPDLKPELTDSYELTAIATLKKLSLNSSVYYRKTSDVISNIIEVDGNQTITRPDNIGKSKDLGLELNAKWEAMKYLVFLLDGNMAFYERYGDYQDSSFSFQNSYWSTRMTTKIKFPADIDMEIRGRYRSAYQDLQMTMEPQYYVDLGLKKKFLKGRAVINLSISDVFNTRRRTSISDEVDFYRFSEFRRGGRRIILGFSFGFGKGKAMEYSGHKMF